MSSRRFPDRPLVGVGAVVLTPDLERVLLVERASPPSAGAWSLPGGLVEIGESLRDACRREVAEETGLVVEPRDLCAVVERVIREPAAGRVEYHYLIVDFWAVAPEQPVRAGTDAAAARWVPVEGLGGLPHTRGLTRAVQRARQLARGEPPDPLFDPLLEGEP